jgi:uncharacterized membrane protein
VTFVVTGRASINRHALPVEYLSILLVGLFSGFGLYAGVRALFARSAEKTSGRETVKRTETNRAVRIIGWVLVTFGLLAACTTLAEVPALINSFFGYATAFCFVLGGACLFAFRQPQK